MSSEKSSEELIKEFERDTDIIVEQTIKFVNVMHPAYMVVDKKIQELMYTDSAVLLDAVIFYRIKYFSSEKVENIQEYMQTKMSRFYTAIHALNKPIIYGVISYNGCTNLVLGVNAENNDAEVIKSIMQGLLDGVELERFVPNYKERTPEKVKAGFISGVPSVRLDDEKQVFDIGSVLKSLNGQNYTLLFISRPIPSEKVSENYGDLIQIRDSCFAVSKRNLSRQYGINHSITETKGNSESTTHSKTKTNGGSFGISFILSANGNHSSSETDSKTLSKNYSQSISDAINATAGESHDVQNGFALEMMEYAEAAIKRLRQGKSNGMWETFISYSSDKETATKIIESCINGEISKPNPDLLPSIIKSDIDLIETNPLIIPKILKNESGLSPLCTCMTSEELGFISSPPCGAVPDFEIRIEKNYPLISDNKSGIILGNLNDGNKTLENMSFILSEKDLVKHTFICGITGSGKTTTVKRIIEQADKPFLVIESAKTEYRSMQLKGNSSLNVYTLGRPEVNCISINPFYIQNGISPQVHIDFLKDLFNASFSFYGPMPYILEKCLHNIYKNKGWNLTLGYHPYLANTTNIEDFFDADYTNKKYELNAHKYLFPTMQDLKDEVERYIEQEMNYEGEVAGNIKTAIKARLENLCSGAKGYMFNTHEYIDMNTLLNEKAVFELEGLADDSDKAFAVGLMIIYINEYRQVCGKRKENESPLAHILIIEEAHRLLKNVATEKSSEDMGNPKGKAVEHFTNMIAEMRSYGQGVIVAEQIPTKLAPEVIKNSSNKIVQRLVAQDDQRVMANTVGIPDEDAIQLGFLSTGKSLCHKEGMCTPVKVEIIPTLDNTVTDSMLYSNSTEERIRKINLSILREILGNTKEDFTVKLLNSMLIQDANCVKESIIAYQDEIKKYCLKNNIQLICCSNATELQTIIISESIIQFLLKGVYKVKALINDEAENDILSVIKSPTNEHLAKLRNSLTKAYGDDIKYKGIYIISMLVINQYCENIDLKKTIDNYFVVSDKETTAQIIQMIKEIKNGNTSNFSKSS